MLPEIADASLKVDLFMTLARLLFPLRREISTDIVATHTVLGLLRLRTTSVKASRGKLSAHRSTRRVSLSLCGFSLVTFRFLAIPQKYLNFRLSNSERNDLLFPYPASIKTIPG